jgi:hypothetical protein
LYKEKEKLELYIRNFKKQKADYDNKFKQLNKNFLKFEVEKNKFNNEKQIFDHQKNLFYSLNFVLNSGQILNNLNCSDQKIDQGNNKLSINNITPQTDVTNSPGSLKKNIVSHTNLVKYSNSKNMSNLNSIKKEIIYEKPNIVTNSSKNREQEYSKDKSTKSSLDLQTQSQSYANSIEKERKNSMDKNNFITNVGQLNYNSSQISNDFNTNNVNIYFIYIE